MEFKFSIRGALREAWNLFKKHFWFFVGLSAVAAVLNIIGNGKHINFIVSIILSIASFLWSIIMMKLSLAAADGKEELFAWGSVKEMFPGWKQALGVLGVGILGGILTLLGLVLLIIPGLWVAFRLSVANLSYLDKGEGIRKALRSSWNLTKGNAFWTAVLVVLVSCFLYIVGLILFGVGILVTYPLAMILMAKFYRALTLHHAGLASTAVVVQPEELTPPSNHQ